MHNDPPIKPSLSDKLLDAETWDALRKAGVPESELEQSQPFGPIISGYSRAQAIEDGVLVDVTPLAQRMGFTIHTAMTCGVVAEVTCGSQVEAFCQASIMVVLKILREEICKLPDRSNTDRIFFEVADWKLWASVGPGDDGESVLTVMLQGED